MNPFKESFYFISIHPFAEANRQYSTKLRIFGKKNDETGNKVVQEVLDAHAAHAAPSDDENSVHAI